MGAILEYYFFEPQGRRLPDLRSDDILRECGSTGVAPTLEPVVFDLRTKQFSEQTANVVEAWVKVVGEFQDGLSINSHRVADFEVAMRAAGLEQMLWRPDIHAKAEDVISFGWVDLAEIPTLIAAAVAGDRSPEVEDVLEILRDAEWAQRSIGTIWG